VALALSTAHADRGKPDSANRQQTLVQHSAAGDALIPPGDAKPCARKPAGLSSQKFVDPDAVCSPRKRESSSLACSLSRNAIALSVPGRGGGRAPPVRALI
jgi:hypothetical protein